MRYGEVTHEELKNALVVLGYAPVMRQVEVKKGNRFETVGCEESGEFHKELAGGEVSVVTSKLDMDWDQHVRMKLVSEPHTVNRFLILGKPGSDFTVDMLAMEAAMVANPKPWN
jgi:hypothetical protein